MQVLQQLYNQWDRSPNLSAMLGLVNLWNNYHIFFPHHCSVDLRGIPSHTTSQHAHGLYSTAFSGGYGRAWKGRPVHRSRTLTELPRQLKRSWKQRETWQNGREASIRQINSLLWESDRKGTLCQNIGATTKFIHPHMSRQYKILIVKMGLKQKYFCTGSDGRNNYNGKTANITKHENFSTELEHLTL